MAKVASTACQAIALSMVIVVAASTVPVPSEYHGLSICHITAQLTNLSYFLCLKIYIRAVPLTVLR